jgi:hypothetical protein
MLVLLAVGPFLRGTHLTQVIVSVVLLYGIYAIKPRKGLLALCIVLVSLDLALSWAGVAIQSGNLQLTGVVLDFFLFSILAYEILRKVLLSRRVTRETIAGGICAYLLLGLIWACVFSLVGAAQPGSFPAELAHAKGEVVRAHGNLMEYTYFSFVTLTTLGYGDIAPLKPAARSLAALEAVTGQLYLAILIARLVATYTSSRARGRERETGEGG